MALGISVGELRMSEVVEAVVASGVVESSVTDVEDAGTDCSVEELGKVVLDARRVVEVETVVAPESTLELEKKLEPSPLPDPL